MCERILRCGTACACGPAGAAGGKLGDHRLGLRDQQLALLVAVGIAPLDAGPVGFARFETLRRCKRLYLESEFGNEWRANDLRP